MSRVSAAAMSAALLLCACAAPSQKFLDEARQGCAKSDVNACNTIPQLQQQVAAEELQQQRDSANAMMIMGGAMVIGAAAYGASRPVYVAPVYRPPVSCYSTGYGYAVHTTCY